MHTACKGGYNAFSIRQGDDLKHIGYDIWKFNSSDYMSRYNPRSYDFFKKYPKLNKIINKSKISRIIPKMGLKFIDKMYMNEKDVYIEINEPSGPWQAPILIQ